MHEITFVDDDYVHVLFSKKIKFSLKNETTLEEPDRIDIDGIGKLVDVPSLLFINEECRNLKAVVDYAELNKKTKSDVLQAYRCSLCDKCYKQDCFFKKHVEYCKSVR